MEENILQKNTQLRYYFESNSASARRLDGTLKSLRFAHAQTVVANLITNSY